MNEPDPMVTGSAQPFEVPASARRLLRLVYIMGVILLLLLVALVAGIIWKANHKAEPRPQAPLQPLALSLPEGSDIRQASLDGDRLVITTARAVIIVDIRKNAVISRVEAGP